MPHTYTWTSPSSLSLPSPPSGAVASTSGTAAGNTSRRKQQQHTVRMADAESGASTSAPPPLVPNDGARPATTAPTTPAGWTATPASRRSSRMTPLPTPQMTPLIDTITARVTADAEKRYNSLQSELDALKKRDAEREQELTLARRSSSQSLRPASQSNTLASRANGGQVWAEYPNFDEQLDFTNTITEVEKRRLKQEMDFYYKMQRENMVKQMHGAFRKKQLELEAKKKGSKRRRGRKRKTSDNEWGYTDRNKYRDGNGDSGSESESGSETDSDDEVYGARGRQVGYTIHGERRDLTDEQFDKLRRDRAKIDVVVATTDTVPGFRCMEKCGTIKVSVPRSLLVVDDTDEEELKHAAEMAKMVRQEVYDKAIGAARRRRANAIVSFKFKAELSQNMDDDNVVLITATGNCCVVRRMVTDREVGLRRALEDGRKRYRREGDLSLLRGYLSQQARASEKRTEQRTLAEMDSKDLMATLAEITGKIQSDFKAKQNTDPQKEMLEKLLGRKVRFDEDPFDSRKPSSPRVAMSPGGSNSGRGREVGSNVAQDVLLSILTGDTEGAASKMSKGRADEWETKAKENKEDGGAAEWAAYDW